jgi:hypothetical protein
MSRGCSQLFARGSDETIALGIAEPWTILSIAAPTGNANNENKIPPRTGITYPPLSTSK